MTPSPGPADDLLAALRALHATRSAEVRERWQRSLPLADYVVDRWERARGLGFGPGSSIYDQSLVLGDVDVGEGTWIGPNTVLDGSGGLRIGATCSISAGVQIYTHDSVRWALSGGRAPYDRAPVVIGDHCYLGPCTVVTSGVTIGRHCLIGAHSLVNRDLPDYSIAWGVPCRVVGRVEVSGADVSFIYSDTA
ncbi:MAG TPA: acyltransferase [Gemmatimonadales bacterium]|nr:acyltransferase [Gemmatimonadales bacterium]